VKQDNTTTETSRELTARGAILANWELLRGRGPERRTALAHLRRHRRTLLADPGQSTRQHVQTLVHAAAVTATIDDLRDPDG